MVNHIRTKVQFSLLRSILLAIRGERGRKRREKEAEMSDLSLNLVPDTVQRTRYEEDEHQGRISWSPQGTAARIKRGGEEDMMDERSQTKEKDCLLCVFVSECVNNV